MEMTKLPKLLGFVLGVFIAHVGSLSAEASEYQLLRAYQAKNSASIFLEVSSVVDPNVRRFFAGTVDALSEIPVVLPVESSAGQTQFTYVDARMRGGIQVTITKTQAKFELPSGEVEIYKALRADRRRTLNAKLSSLTNATGATQWLPLSVYEYGDLSGRLLVLEGASGAIRPRYRILTGNHRTLRETPFARIREGRDGELTINLLDGPLATVFPSSEQSGSVRTPEMKKIAFSLRRVSPKTAGIHQSDVGSMSSLAELKFPSGVFDEEAWKLQEPGENEDGTGLYIVPEAGRWKDVSIQHAFEDLHGNLLVKFTMGYGTVSDYLGGPGIINPTAWFWGNRKDGLFAMNFLGWTDDLGPDQVRGWRYEDLSGEMGEGGSIYSADNRQKVLITRNESKHAMDRVGEEDVKLLMRAVKKGEIKVHSLPGLYTFSYFQLVNKKNDPQPEFLVVSSYAYEAGVETRVWSTRLDGSVPEELFIESGNDEWTLSDHKGFISFADVDGNNVPGALLWNGQRYVGVKVTGPYLMDERFVRDFMADMKVKPFIPRTPSEVFAKCVDALRMTSSGSRNTE